MTTSKKLPLTTLENIIQRLQKEESRSRNACNYAKADRLDAIAHELKELLPTLQDEAK